MSQNVLVGLIYEAIDDPLVWGAFLTKFAEAVHSETAGLCTEDKAGQWGRNLATVGVDPASRKSYEEYFVSRNPWQPRRKMFAGNVETGEQLVSNRELVTTEFYKEFLKPNGWLYECRCGARYEQSPISSEVKAPLRGERRVKRRENVDFSTLVTALHPRNRRSNPSAYR